MGKVFDDLEAFVADLERRDVGWNELAASYHEALCKLHAVEAELAATKGAAVSCETHSWVGDDECAYCKADDYHAAWLETTQRAEDAESRLGECEERFQAGRDAWEMLEKSVADLNALPGAREMRDALTGIMLVAPDLSDTEWAKEAAARVDKASPS